MASPRRQPRPTYDRDPRSSIGEGAAPPGRRTFGPLPFKLTFLAEVC